MNTKTTFLAKQKEFISIFSQDTLCSMCLYFYLFFWHFYTKAGSKCLAIWLF